MSLHRRAAKRDAAEPAIVETLRWLGWSVKHLSIKDGPDLVLGRDGFTHLAEVKSGAGKLRDGQSSWHSNWRGAPVFVLRSVKDAIRFHNWHLSRLS